MAHHGTRVKVVDRDYDALEGAHALVLLTEWRSYRAPNFAEIRKRLVDSRRRKAAGRRRRAQRVAAVGRGARRAAVPGHRRPHRGLASGAQPEGHAALGAIVARIVVTGGVGFIGYHFTRALLARGDDVVVVDDFSDAPYPAAEKRRNERDLLAEFPRVRWCAAA